MLDINFRKALGEAVALTSMVLIIILYFFASINGLFNGEYMVVTYTNTLYEHWFEFILILCGFYWYVKYRGIHFTLHPNNRKGKED
jgi:hypothetical protein